MTEDRNLKRVQFCYSVDVSLIRYLPILLVVLSAVSARAEFNLELQRRFAVFPIAENNSSLSEDAWWQIRELLTKDQRFMVASKRFMINRGVFQPRKSLKPADAIILAKILDAQALVTSWVEDRKMFMRVYEGQSGYCIWESDGEFHPAIPISDQLIKVGLRLINDFLMALPYQGFQVTDERIGKPIYDQDAKKYAQVFLGANQKVAVGDPAHWISIQGESSPSLLNNSPRVTVIAEGVVTRILQDKVEIEILKMSNPDLLAENALVRFPKEVTRLKDLYASEERGASLGTEYLSGEMKSVEDSNRDSHPTVTALAFIFNLAGMILLAF